MPLDPKTKNRAYIVGLFRPDLDEDKNSQPGTTDEKSRKKRGFYPFATKWEKEIRSDPPGQMPWHYAKNKLGAHPPTFEAFCKELDPQHLGVEVGTLDENNLFVQHGFGVLTKKDPKYTAFTAAPGGAVAQQLATNQATLAEFYRSLHAIVNDFANWRGENNADLGAEFYPALLKEIFSREAEAAPKTVSISSRVRDWLDHNNGASRKKLEKHFEAFRDVRRICGSSVMLNMVLNWPLLYLIQKAAAHLKSKHQAAPHEDKAAVIAAYAALRHISVGTLLGTGSGFKSTTIDAMEEVREKLIKETGVKPPQAKLTLTQIQDACERHEDGYRGFLLAREEERVAKLEAWLRSLPGEVQLSTDSREELLEAGREFAKCVEKLKPEGREIEAGVAAKTIVDNYVRALLGFAIWDMESAAREFRKRFLELEALANAERVGGAGSLLKAMGETDREKDEVKMAIGDYDKNKGKVEEYLMKGAARAIQTYATSELSGDAIAGKQMLGDGLELLTGGMLRLGDDERLAVMARPNLNEEGTHRRTFMANNPLAAVLQAGFKWLPETLAREMVAEASMDERREKESTDEEVAEVEAASSKAAKSSSTVNPKTAVRGEPKRKSGSATPGGTTPKAIVSAPDAQPPSPRLEDVQQDAERLIKSTPPNEPINIERVRALLRGRSATPPAPASGGKESTPSSPPARGIAEIDLTGYAECITDAWHRILNHGATANEEYQAKVKSLQFLESILVLGKTKSKLPSDERSHRVRLAKDLIDAGSVEGFLRDHNPLDYVPLVESHAGFDGLVRLLLDEEASTLESLRLLVSELAGVKVLFDSVAGNADVEIIVFNGTADEFLQEIEKNITLDSSGGESTYLVPTTDLNKQAIPGVVYFTNLAFMDERYSRMNVESLIEEYSGLREAASNPTMLKMIERLVSVWAKTGGYDGAKKAAFLQAWGDLCHRASTTRNVRKTVLPPALLTLGQEKGASGKDAEWVKEEDMPQGADLEELLVRAPIHFVGPSLFLRAGSTQPYAPDAKGKEIFVTTLPAGYPLLAGFLGNKIAYAKELKYSGVQFLGKAPLGTFTLAEQVSHSGTVENLLRDHVLELPPCAPAKSDGEKWKPRLELSYHVFAALLTGVEQGLSPEERVTDQTFVFSEDGKNAQRWRKTMAVLVRESKWEEYWLAGEPAGGGYPSDPPTPLRWHRGPVTPELQWLHTILSKPA